MKNLQEKINKKKIKENSNLYFKEKMNISISVKINLLYIHDLFVLFTI